MATDYIESLLSIIQAQTETIRIQADQLRAISARRVDLGPYPPGVELPPPDVEEIPDEVRVRLRTPEEMAAREQAERVRRAVEVPRPTRVTAKPHVYFVQQGDSGAIKIGCSKDPTKRLATLQCGHSEHLRMLTCAPGTQQQERALHDRFAHLRVSGEWFRPGDDLLAYIRLVTDRRSL